MIVPSSTIIVASLVLLPQSTQFGNFLHHMAGLSAVRVVFGPFINHLKKLYNSSGKLPLERLSSDPSLSTFIDSLPQK